MHWFACRWIEPIRTQPQKLFRSVLLRWIFYPSRHQFNITTTPGYTLWRKCCYRNGNLLLRAWYARITLISVDNVMLNLNDWVEDNLNHSSEDFKVKHFICYVIAWHPWHMSEHMICYTSARISYISSRMEIIACWFNFPWVHLAMIRHWFR